jgi:hypothetical protein
MKDFMQQGLRGDLRQVTKYYLNTSLIHSRTDIADIADIADIVEITETTEIANILLLYLYGWKWVHNKFR